MEAQNSSQSAKDSKAASKNTSSRRETVKPPNTRDMGLKASVSPNKIGRVSNANDLNRSLGGRGTVHSRP